MIRYVLTLSLSLLLLVCAATTTTAVVFTVTTSVDAGPGTLRDAMMAANGTPGPDIIVFAIMPPGPHTITPLSPLPPLTDPAGVFMDGTTQPGGADCGPSPPSTALLLIEISGGAAGPTAGLTLWSDFNHIRGIVVNRFAEDGILIEAGPANPTAIGNLITCCFIGTDPSGTLDFGNGTSAATLFGGVRIKNTGGGSVALDNAVDGCLLSGNYADGATIWGPIVPGDVGVNTIINCYIGTDITGTVALGNDNEGVSMVEGTHDNVVTRNLISGNGFDGVGIQGFNNIGFGPPILTIGNHIEDNIIGLDATGIPLPNLMHGVAIGTYGPAVWGCAYGNFVELNTIAENGISGVNVFEDAVDFFNTDRNLISKNSIYNNGGLGIDLHAPGVNPNDPADPDVLANEEMNFPVIDSANEAAGVTTIYGSLDTPSPMTATVEVFKARLDPSGHGEGEVYLGSTTPNAAGIWAVTVTGLIVGDSVTATATDAGNNTSEFSRCIEVTGASCCVGIRGDVNGDGSVNPNILDLNWLVNYLFRSSGNPGPCLPESDVNATGGNPNILDLNILVNYLFRFGPLPGPC